MGMKTQSKNQQSRGAGSAAKQSATIQLDPVAAEHVAWYSGIFGRDTNDIVNGIVTGSLAHLREDNEEGRDGSDDTGLEIDEQICAAIMRARRDQ